MALWYECGNGMVKTSFAKSQMGADAYLCCPGPSLADVRPQSLHVPGVTVFALNTAYPYIRPDVWIGMDLPECYDSRIWWESFMKICRGGYRNAKKDDFPISMGNNVFFADMEECAIADIFVKRAHDVHFCWQKDTLMAALHVMVWMGATKIHLVGCDLGGKKDYYDDRVLTDVQRDYNHRLYRVQEKRLQVFAEVASKYNIKVISCTPDSPINAFLEYSPLKDCLASSQMFAPKSGEGGGQIHASVAQHCQWTPNPRQEQGVIIGCAPVQEDLIPWCVETYKKYNDYPLAFADFGISKKAKAYCKEHGQLISMTDVDVEGWFRKPFAILRAPFRKILWLDVDVELRGDVQVLFALAKQGKIAAGEDSYNAPQFRKHLAANQVLWDSGVVATEHGNSVIKKWAEKIGSVSKGVFLGDHEPLSLVVYENGFPMNTIPKHIHRMRLDGFTGPSMLYHWTGPKGKEHIRRNLMQCKNA